MPCWCRIPRSVIRAARIRLRGGGLMSLFRPPRMGRSQNRDAGPAATAKRTVWVLRNNNPVSVAIETGSTDGQHTVVKSGELKADDQVITDATARNAG